MPSEEFLFATHDSSTETTAVVDGDGTNNIAVAQQVDIPPHAEITDVSMRLAKFAGSSASDNVFIQIATGATPGSSVEATSDQLAISSLPTASLLNDGDPLWGLTSFTFASPYVVDTGSVYVVVRRTGSGTLSDSVDVSVWTGARATYAGGNQWRQDSASWDSIATVDAEFKVTYVLPRLFITKTGFRFPYPRWN